MQALYYRVQLGIISAPTCLAHLTSGEWVGLYEDGWGSVRMGMTMTRDGKGDMLFGTLLRNL